MGIDVDLSTSEHFTGGPPLELFEQMRHEEPVRWNESADGTGFWSLTRYDDINTVIRDWKGFSSARRGIFLGTILPLEFQRLGFSTMDPPGHDRQRGLLSKAFTPRIISAQAEEIARTADHLIDTVIDRGECDFVVDIATELPLTVVSKMLGVPDGDRHLLFGWTNKMADTELAAEDILAMYGEMTQYVLALIADRRSNPGDDLISRLVEAELDGERLRDEEIVMHFAQLMAGGNETTRNALAGGLRALIESPEERQALIDEPDLMPNAVEEILRWHTPIMHSARTATQDTHIDGVPIKEDDLVVTWHISANRDQAANPHPYRFDIRRTGIKHASFGAGKHYCIGAALARLEISITLNRLLNRLSTIELAGPVTHHPSNTFHWIRNMPISFDAAR